MAKRPTQEEFPVEGEGVAPVKDKVLNRLGSQFIELRDAKADTATKLGDCEAKIRDRMKEIGVTKYRFADQLMELKENDPKVKIRTVETEAGISSEPEAPEVE